MPSPGDQRGYSTFTGILYVFNLIVGTGTLALPGLISEAGWLPAIILITILGFISFMTVTFIIETLAVANAVGRQRTLQVLYDDEEDEPLLENNNDFYEIKDKFEMTELATALLSRPARIAVVVCLISYLFGDLAIYCAVMGRTLAHTTCSQPANATCNTPVEDSEMCWPSVSLSRLDVYRVYVCLVVIVLGPLVFMNVQKTKWLQMLTSGVRWTAFSIMIIWSLQKLSSDGPKGDHVMVKISALPALFGGCIYSFMCQHSVPSLIQPVSNKQKFLNLLPYNYAQISIFYLFLSMTAVWTFKNVEDLYTLNFWTDSCMNNSSSILFLDYFLALFPVFTLSTSFPIIAITLRNNLQDLLPVTTSRVTFVAVSVTICVVPCTLALLVTDLQLLVGVVGSYAGTALQYLAPALLVSAARSRSPSTPENPYRSPFQHKGWIVAVHCWSSLSLVLITINYILNYL